MGVGLGGGVTVFYLKFVFGTVVKDMHVVRFYLMNKVKRRDMMHYIPMHALQEKKYESYLYYFRQSGSFLLQHLYTRR